MMIGSHAGRDAKGGFPVTLEQMYQMGCKCVQVVVGSTIARLSESAEKKYLKEAKAVKDVLQRLEMKLFVHSPYTLNFAKDPDGEADGPYWIDWMVRLLKICDAMGAEGCVLHMGKAVGLGVDVAQKFFFENLCSVIDHMGDMKTKLIIETSAGQGTELYPTLQNNMDPLVEFFEQFTEEQRKHVGLCVDTCHIFAAGYDISTEEGAQRFWREFEERIGLEHLIVVHMNDSMKGLGARVDRHAPLESGKIGLEGLGAFAKQANLYEIPQVLETPTPARDIVVLRRLIEGTYSQTAVDIEVRDRMFMLS